MVLQAGVLWLFMCQLFLPSNGQWNERFHTPRFTRIDDNCLEHEDYEVRSPHVFYMRNMTSSPTWVETSRDYHVTGRNERRPLDLSYLYRKLYRYVTGANDWGSTIQVVEPDCSPRGVFYYRNITLPVVLKLKHRDDWPVTEQGQTVKVTMMMRVDTYNPPTPTDNDVRMVQMPRSFFLRPFRLRTKDVDPAQMARHAEYLKCELKWARVGFNRTQFYVASYEGRFATRSRRPYLHHVMMEATPPLLTFEAGEAP